MSRHSQTSFLPKTRLDHGGDIARGKRKIARPFDPARPMHVVLRSSRARGEWSLLRPQHEATVKRLIRDCARKYDVRVDRFVNVGNHLHLIAQPRARAYATARRDFSAFLRAFAGQIAFQVTGAKKGNRIARAATEVRGFWDKLAYSRIINWGREYDVLKKYLVKNLFEAAGAWDRKRFPGLELISVSFENVGVPPPTG